MSSHTKQIFRFPIKYLAVVNNNKNDLARSTSGGAFILFAKEIIKQNGVVFGCVMDDDGTCYQSYTTTYQGL